MTVLTAVHHNVVCTGKDCNDIIHKHNNDVETKQTVWKQTDNGQDFSDPMSSN